MYIYIYIYINIPLYLYIYTCMYIYIYNYRCTCTYVYMCSFKGDILSTPGWLYTVGLPWPAESGRRTMEVQNRYGLMQPDTRAPVKGDLGSLSGAF